MAIARHLQRHQRTGLLTLGKVEIGHGAGRQAADVAVPANKRITETLLEAPVPRRTPDCPSEGLTLFGGGDCAHKFVSIDIFAAEHSVHAKQARRTRIAVIAALTQECDGSKPRPAGQILGPIDPAATGPAVREQHGIVCLPQEFGRKQALVGRIPDDELRIRPQRDEPLADACAQGAVLFYQQQTY